MITGLRYIPNFVSEHSAKDLIDTIDHQFWMTDMKRRVQHYGYVYDYKKRIVTSDMALGGLPDWLADLAEQVHTTGYISAMPDQVIINEYVPGQGISPHVDCEPCFDDTILSLSLGSACLMDFTHIEGQHTNSILLAPRSLLIMAGEARYDWKHGIATRKSDVVDGKRVARQRRISLTMRKVILDD
ncbi:MAG: alpha-ketoglutarate-dependent dioxygenase AlkB [Chloroflexota bacterium]